MELTQIEKTCNYNITVLYAALVGSKLYGTASENSDTDIRFIFQPDPRDVILGKAKDTIRITPQTKEKNTKDDIDFDGWSLSYFFQLLKKGDTNAFDLLFSMQSNSVIKETEISLKIKEQTTEFLNKNVRGFVGYCLAQTRKFGIKGERYSELNKFIDFLGVYTDENGKLLGENFNLETIWKDLKNIVEDDNFQYIKFIEAPGPNNETWEYISVLGKLFHKNVKIDYFLVRIKNLDKQFGNRTKNTSKTENKKDPKATYHALRVALELEELLKTGKIEFPLKDSSKLIKIKYGDFDYEEVVQEIESVIDRTDELLLRSSLPEKSNAALMEDLIVESFNSIRKYETIKDIMFK